MTQRKPGILLLVVLMLALLTTAAYAAHPAEGKKIPEDANALLCQQAGVPEGWDINELTFIKTGDYPTVDELTYLEIYMIAGVNWEKDGKTWGMSPWSNHVFTAVNRFYDLYGYVPEVLDEEIIHMTPGYEKATGDKLNEFRNPLTGEWPVLNAADFSPGDMYIRPLTEEEKIHFAALNSTYDDHWFKGHGYNMIEKRDVQYTMLSEPFYIRMYGLNDVILTYIQYIHNYE